MTTTFSDFTLRKIDITLRLDSVSHIDVKDLPALESCLKDLPVAQLRALYINLKVLTSAAHRELRAKKAKTTGRSYG